MKKEIPSQYLRVDLNQVAGVRTAYYRLTKELVEFLNLLEKKEGHIIGIELDRKEDGSIGFNIGFSVAKLSEEKDES